MRVPITTLKRLAAVEGALYGEDGKSRGGVLLVPPIMTLDAWESLAVPALAKLAASAAEDIDRRRDDDTAPVRRERPARVATATTPPQHRAPHALPKPTIR